MIHIDNKEVASIFIDNKEVQTITIGGKTAYEKTPQVPDYFYIEDSGSSFTLTTDKGDSLVTSNVTPTIQYSEDKVNWTTLTLDWSTSSTTTTIQHTVGEKVYFRNNTGKFSYINETDKASTNKGLIIFNCSSNYNVGGDLRSLIDYTDIDNAVPTTNGTFAYMFFNSYSDYYLGNASNLKLPTVVTDYCCVSMFRYCRALTSAPVLTATTLADYCYTEMFKRCIALTTAPALPATTLANGCYEQMFEECTSLVNAPALQATTLGSYCYKQMFNGCSALTAAPALPATTLADGCYEQMFNLCTALVNAPVLPATTLADRCYSNMFSYCTSLTAAPALPATTLNFRCYANMFYGCTSLNKVITYANDISASSCTENWLQYVSNSGTLYNGGTAVYTTDDPSGVPVGWSETSAPVMTSVTVTPNTFNAKSWMDKARVSYTIIGHNSVGIDVPLSNVSNEKINIGINTGDTSRTVTESKTYDSLSYTLTFNQSANDPYPDYFWIYNSSNASSTFDLMLQGSETAGKYIEEIEWSTDRNTWTTMTLEGSTSFPITINQGEKVYFRNDNGKFNTQNRQVSFRLSNFSADVGGNLRTLLDYFDDNVELNESHQFRQLFSKSGGYYSTYLVNAQDLIIPFSKMTGNCFQQMFAGCSNLTTTPSLPATTLASSCYNEMFRYCSALTTAPALPSTTLAGSCYRNMFNGCTSLTTAPALPATTLQSRCYQSMFGSCTSLTTAPALSATTLVDYCYREMFSGCSQLNSVTSYAQNLSGTTPLTNWLKSVAATGTFYNNGGARYTRDSSGIPSGWTEVLPT